MMTSPLVGNSAMALAPTSVVNIARMKHTKKVLTGLGIAEFVIGTLAIVISCILISYVCGWSDYRSWSNYNNPFHRDNNNYQNIYYKNDDYRLNIGEGIWCGVWILISGILGIASGRKRSTLCLINCHMGFSIVGTIFSGVLLSMGILSALVNRVPISIFLQSLLAFGGFVTFILCIVSAAYCCKTTSSAGCNTCCGTCCIEEQVARIGVGQTMQVAIPHSRH